ncbi:MAG: hypothetical protein ACE5KM_07685, partial [Planctomycetaceae bacterium]
MSLRKTIKWMLSIVVALGLAGGGYAYWMWSHANALLLEHIRAAVAQKAPGWDVEIGAAKFDWHRRIHIYNVTLRDRTGAGTILHVPEAVLAVDREKLAESQVVDVQRIRLIGPELSLVRDGRGRWNFQKLPPLKPTGKRPPLPEIVVENATVDLRLEQADGGAPADFQLRQLGVKLVPQGARRFVVEGGTTVRDAGKLTLSGTWNVDAGTWSFDGRMPDLHANGELLALAAGASPALRANVARIDAALRQHTPAAERPKVPVDADALPDFGASAIVDVDFHLARHASVKELQFDVNAKVRDGRIDNPALPVTLHDVQADVHWTNERVEIREVSAQNGTLRLAADADIRRAGTATPARIRLNVVNLPLDDRLKRRLPSNWRTVYDRFRPAGRIALACLLDYDGRTWKPHNLVVTTRNCSFAYAKYPYRFTSVNGTVTQRADTSIFDFKFNGRAGRQPATLTGRLRNPGPNAVSRFDLSIQGLLLDDVLIAACPPSSRKALKALNIRGRIDGWLTTTHRAGVDKTPRLQLTADMRNCVVAHEKFPYRLEALTGRVTFDSQTHDWKFTRLRARKGQGTFSGSGFLIKRNGRQELELNVTGIGAQLDKSLYRALPESLQHLWDDLSPTGKLDLTSRLRWRDGEPVDISISHCTLSNGTMLVKSFPYAFKKIAAKFAYEKPRLRILSFTAAHDETRVRAEGFAETSANGEWRLRLVKFLADDLVPDRTFRRALSPGLRSVFEELNPRGPVSITGKVLEFRGTSHKEDPVTAAWDLKTVFAGNSLKMGVELKNVHGRAYAKGTWDGKLVEMIRTGNRLDLDSIHVRGYQFTKVKGPFRLYGKHLVVGSGEFFKRRRRGEKVPPVDPKKRITADAVGGTFTLDADVEFEKQADYRILLTVNQARLEKFARRYLKNSRNLRGVVNGRIQLEGKGRSSKGVVGRGRLLISPAALYELPVLVQTFKALTFVPPDKTAFKQAYADF